MVNRSIELRKANRPTIRHENQNLPTEEESQAKSTPAEPANKTTVGGQIDIQQPTSSDIRRPQLNRLTVETSNRRIENQNASQLTEIRANQILNRSDSAESNSSSNVGAETTLFEQVAMRVYQYKANCLYMQRLPGILNLLQLFFGLLTFILIINACNNYYDPWQGIVISGFAGGKVEVFFFLTSSYALITTAIFTILILISNTYEKHLNVGNFNFIINFIIFAFLMFSSVLLLIELSNRNTGILQFEHRFGVKVTCAILGILNALFYLLSSSILFKITPKATLGPRTKNHAPKVRVPNERSQQRV